SVEALSEMQVESLQQPADNMPWHEGIDLAGKFDKARDDAIFPSLPRKIKRVDRDAMSAQPRAWVERHVTEGVSLGAIDDLPYVDANRLEDDLQFVNQSNIDGSEDVLSELHRLGGAHGADRDGL